MSDPKRNKLEKQGSLSYIEQSLKITPIPPQQAPVTIYPGPKAGDMNLSKADLEIADRLEKLRKKDTALPTEEEMASRLAQLKGLPSDHYKKPSIVYQPPDKRSQTKQSDDLFKQMMSEIALDAKVPRPEDEIEARLAKLRGNSTSDHTETSAPIYKESENLTSPGSQPASLDCMEVEDLLRQATKESQEASASLKALSMDKDLQKAMAKAAKRKESRTRSDSTSSEERCSEDDTRRKSGRLEEGNPDTAKEKEEVDKIVRMYTQKAQQKKEKRRRRALMKKPPNKSSSSSSSGDSDLSSTSDLALSTSESEKLSDSD